MRIVDSAYLVPRSRSASTISEIAKVASGLRVASCLATTKISSRHVMRDPFGNTCSAVKDPTCHAEDVNPRVQARTYRLHPGKPKDNVATHIHAHDPVGAGRLPRREFMDTKLVKARGEHWVCSVLAGLGWSVALTRDGLERTDILASHGTLDRMIEVQVKAASFMPKPNWRVNTKAQQLARSEREWFVFVALAKDPWGTNRGFIVPRDHVAATAWLVHQDWLTDPTVAAGKRNVGLEQARVHAPHFAGYEDRWDLLETPTTTSPVLLSAELRGLALNERVGLPPGHPWQSALPAW